MLIYKSLNFNVHTEIQTEGQVDGFNLIDLASDPDKQYIISWSTSSQQP